MRISPLIIGLLLVHLLMHAWYATRFEDTGAYIVSRPAVFTKGLVAARFADGTSQHVLVLSKAIVFSKDLFVVNFLYHESIIQWHNGTSQVPVQLDDVSAMSLWCEGPTEVRTRVQCHSIIPHVTICTCLLPTHTGYVSMVDQGRYGLITKLELPSSPPWEIRYALSVCSAPLQDNLAHVIPEWIEYHLLQGVEHFYLYLPYSNMSLPTVLQRYVTAGLVTFREFNFGNASFVKGTEQFLQTQAQQDCLAQFSDSSAWIAFIDTDEYLFSPSGLTVRQLVDQQNGNLSALVIRMISFEGTSSNSSLVIERWKRRAPRVHLDGRTKVIVQTNNTFSVTIHHLHKGSRFIDVKPHLMRLNHYVSLHRTRSFTSGLVTDTSALVFVDKLKQALSSR